ncbi:hypothetical protein [Phenylobacterium deserti]|uniref:Uncharacterized protein n=1 Tax=Phenylobacterium deserti TaxID=1914756 RepID=A0A328A8G0_9CAUL|nr:hypothetical protein [Phenylobacterium deserti]RAK50872.1 hypothetical protein DJ018_17010 [Phenylobacterium deserti]
MSHLSEELENYLIWALALLAAAPIAMAAVRRYEQDEPFYALGLLAAAGIVLFACLAGLGQVFHG